MIHFIRLSRAQRLTMIKIDNLSQFPSTQEKFCCVFVAKILRN